MSALPTIVAHRGASHDAPENTQAAFVLAWLQGADAIEADFRLTKDGHVVCIHDETTARTANRDVDVARSTLHALKQLDFGSSTSREWRGQTIQTLQEVLATVPDGKRLFLEIKCGTEILEPLRQILAGMPGSASRVVIQSFDHQVIKAARPMFPDFTLLLLVSRRRVLRPIKWTPAADEIMAALDETGADGVNASAAGLMGDGDLVRRVLESGRQVHAWTVNRGGNALALHKAGVQSITTDRPGWLLGHLVVLTTPSS